MLANQFGEADGSCAVVDVCSFHPDCHDAGREHFRLRLVKRLSLKY